MSYIDEFYEQHGESFKEEILKHSNYGLGMTLDVWRSMITSMRVNTQQRKIDFTMLQELESFLSKGEI